MNESFASLRLNEVQESEYIKFERLNHATMYSLSRIFVYKIPFEVNHFNLFIKSDSRCYFVFLLYCVANMIQFTDVL